MVEFVGSKDDILSRALSDLVKSTNIRQTIAGSKARSAYETFSKELESVARLNNLNHEKSMIPTSYGKSLDDWGKSFGMTRRSASTAEVLAEDRVIKFFVRTGDTFGSINGGSSFTIPEGTSLVAPAEIAEEAVALFSGIDDADSVHDRSIHYVTTEAVSCESDKKEAYASVKALTPGISGNLAAPYMLTSHDFRAYNDHIGQTLLVANVKPILNGHEAEGDASYRYRISKKITDAAAANNTSIIQAALSVAGVADVIIVPWQDGVGTFNVFIKSISSNISDRLVEDVQTAINKKLGNGNVGYAKPPYFVGIEINTNLVYTEDVTDNDKEAVRSAAAVAAVSYLNSLDMGEPLLLNVLSERVRSVDSRIAAVGRNEVTRFDNIHVYFPAKLATNGRRRERLITASLEVPMHSRIIAETSVDDPVRMT
jgi:uncharacterized phage protein gp47/JayE